MAEVRSTRTRRTTRKVDYTYDGDEEEVSVRGTGVECQVDLGDSPRTTSGRRGITAIGRVPQLEVDLSFRAKGDPPGRAGGARTAKMTVPQTRRRSRR